jgi:tetraacyldisaccharide 4'-kinase
LNRRLASIGQALWYRATPPPLALRGLAAIYGALSARIAERRKRQAVRLPVPVVVVGNLAVGGTGKTPFVIWLVEALRARGHRPGVVSRGYGGQVRRYPSCVTEDTDPACCGDEPALLARRLRVPVAVAPDRVAAARALVEAAAVDVIVADDGLQHYRLARDLEICVVDGVRGLGNGSLLPAGPLREPPARLQGVNLVVVNGGSWRTSLAPCVAMRLRLEEALALRDGARRPLAQFAGRRVHAVAGIGHPARFFAALRAAGLEPIEHPFPDHHRFVPADLAFGDDLPVLMTEKDAVKCTAFAAPGWWAVPAQAELSAADGAAVRQLLESLFARPAAAHG